MLEKPAKNPVLAASLSAFIPGAGYAYLGMWQTAFLNFALTAICFVGMSELYNNDLPLASLSFAMVGSIFYVGGIIGSGTSAIDINNKSIANEVQTLRYWALPALKFEVDF